MLGTLHVGSSHSVNHKKHNKNKIITERALNVRNTTLGFLKICQSQESLKNQIFMERASNVRHTTVELLKFCQSQNSNKTIIHLGFAHPAGPFEVLRQSLGKPKEVPRGFKIQEQSWNNASERVQKASGGPWK